MTRDTITTEIAIQLAQEYARQREREILSTDWNEWDIVDIVEYEYLPLSPDTLTLPEMRVYRYREKAPPLDTYADGTHTYTYTVQRVTKPLLDKVLRERAKDR